MKKPPIAKVYEALSAIADDRIKMESDHALVTSSNYSKTYTVKFFANLYSSNDNATYWQHYPGYPIIAALIKQNRIKISVEDQKFLVEFKNVNWKKLNTKFKNDYDKAINQFLSTINNQQNIASFVNHVYSQLVQLDLQIKGNRTKLIKEEPE